MGDFNGENYNDKFIGDLVNFVAGDTFQSMFESFFLEHAMQFEAEEEHQLLYYELYQKFHDMFDKQLDDFCSSLNMSQSEFMKRCRAASTQDTKAGHYINILLSSVEYETFVKLMKIMRPVAEQRAAVTGAGKKADSKDGSDAGTSSKMSKDSTDDSTGGVSGGSDAKAEGKSSEGDAPSDAKSNAADEKGSK
ncbi:the ARF-like 2 binding protein BART-domain-containing protein [Ochromonadaceae sp. CCMP2298]|nr:the ARF-like 2 binding protein BART-domain-containing protein [Ochromonadaceae sp. CCMP2298]|mmetsp:Transcript_31317/g.69067  ORF Transcript_31317/g.69067 Transcript_31317/m.69067 type:complete len:193 (+) Transcript_31317:100-678(+)